MTTAAAITVAVINAGLTVALILKAMYFTTVFASIGG